MLTMLRAVLITASLLIAGALPAAAQQVTPAPAPAQQQATIALTANQIGAIAIGAVAGAVILHGLARLPGAVLGGIIGYWIYTQPATATVAQGG